jgi:serine/threonine protein kinase
MTERYTILGSLAQGGMARVYLGRMAGTAGFSRLVAIKRLHAPYAAEKDFVAMLLDEARLTAQIRHANVINTIDLVASAGAFSIVLEYVEGESLASLVRHSRNEGEPVSMPIALAVVRGMLRGLDAAHETRDENGDPLGIVHRDVSPQNVLVGVDGIPRIIDFGVAKALGRMYSTRPGEVRGKFEYMAPEQLQGNTITRQADVYAAGVVLWELLAGAPLFQEEDARTLYAAVLRGKVAPPSSVNPEIPPELDDIVMKATARDLGRRYLTAREFLQDLEGWEKASEDEVGAWVRSLCAERLLERQQMIQRAQVPTDGRPIEELIDELGPRQEGEAEDPHAQAFESTPDQKPTDPSGSAVEISQMLAQPGPEKRMGLAVAMLAIAAASIFLGGLLAMATKQRTLIRRHTAVIYPDLHVIDELALETEDEMVEAPATTVRRTVPAAPKPVTQRRTIVAAPKPTTAAPPAPPPKDPRGFR